jgi:putative endonuclease
MTGARHLELGSAGEEAALATYRARGFELVAQNWRCPLGEIDLVLRRDGLVVVCEVKTRRGFDLGGPFEAVGPRKQRKLRLLAQAFLASVTVDHDAVRFDVASVLMDAAGRPAVELFEEAF